MTALPEFPLSPDEIGAFVDRCLAEDVGGGDVTTEAMVPESAKMTGVLAARQELVVAGQPLGRAIVERLAPDAAVEIHHPDGDLCGAGEIIARIAGPARGLLTAERAVLNILQHLSGIATLTRRYVNAIADTRAVLLDTRKTTPGLRALEKYATALGGAQNHRMGLFDAVLIKDNHIALAGGIEAAVAAAKRNWDKAIEVECDTLEQAEAAIEAGADRLLLDNMAPETLARAVEAFGGKVPLEASGGVTLETIGAIAASGVDYISVGAITQSAPAVDIGFDFETAKGG